MNGTATRQAAAAATAIRDAHASAAYGLPSAGRSVATHGRLSAGGGLPRQALYVAIDIAMVCLGATAVYWVRFGVPHVTTSLPGARFPLHGLLLQGYASFLILYTLLIVLACIGQDLYRTPRELNSTGETVAVSRAVGLATAVLVLFIFTSGNKEISRLVVTCSGLLNIVTLSSWRYAKRRFVSRRLRRGIGTRRALIVGTGRTGRELAACFEQNHELGYEVCGFLDMHSNGNKSVLGSVADLRRVALAQFADEVFVTPPVDQQAVKQVFLEARSLRLDMNVVPDLYDGLGRHAPVRTIGGFPALMIHGQPIPAVGLAVKRLVDVVAAAAGLALALPVLALVAAWICLDSRGSAIYTAPRIGKKGKKFNCYKLRTMVADADSKKEKLRGENERNGPFFKMEKDPRVTRCGHWLRKYSIDELPQLVNVLRGDMSLVGPRPHPVDDFERYTVENLRRLDVKPGVTGLWQVTARRDPSFETNMALDLEYIEKWTLWLDAKILLKTIPAVVRAEGR